MAFTLKICPVGPWPVNSYLLICQQTQTCAIIDPGADAAVILEQAANTRVSDILITHGHEDHVTCLEEVRRATGATARIHQADVENFNLACDLTLQDGEEIRIGETPLKVIHAPGHTPGMCCFDLGDGRVLVGDTVFIGGPGKTWSAEAFSRQMQTMQEIVFNWPEDTVFYPGHGLPGRIGDERPAYEEFVRRGWSSGLFGDVTWV